MSPADGRPEGGSGFGDLVYATVPLGSVATKVARDWLANELYEPWRPGAAKLMRPGKGRGQAAR